MRKYLNKHKRINGSQHGFKGRSCLTIALEFFEAVSDWVDEGRAVDVVCQDFQEAFYMVSLLWLLLAKVGGLRSGLLCS